MSGSQSHLLLPAEEKFLCLSDDDDGDGDSLLPAELDFGGEDDAVQQIAPAGFGSGLINLLKTILGAGMLAMPAAMASVGWLLGGLMIAGTGALAIFTLQLYAHCGREAMLLRGTRQDSIGKLSRHTHPGLGYFFDFAVALKCLGVAVTYLIVIGDMVPSIVRGLGYQEEGWLLSRRLWILLLMVPLAGLASLRRIDSLRYTSFGGLLAVAYLILLAVWNFAKPDAFRPPPNAEIEPIARLSLSSLRSLPIFIFAFTCHQNLLAIQTEAKDSSVRAMSRIVGWAVGLSGLAYLAFSLISYANFGSVVQSNIFRNYPDDSFEMIFARLLFTLLSAFSYPLQTHPCRASLLNMISGRTRRPPTETAYRLVTAAILIATTAVAMVQDDLRVVSGVIGTFAGIPICYIFPALFYRKLHATGWRFKMARGVIALGLFLIVICTIALLA